MLNFIEWMRNRGRATHWSNKGEFYRELRLEPDGSIYDATNDTPNVPVLQKLAPILKQLSGDTVELVIEFQSEGYHDPGSMYGGPDNLGSPPEGEDERTLVRAYISDSGKTEIIPQDIAQELFDHYIDEIQEIDINDDYDDD